MSRKKKNLDKKEKKKLTKEEKKERWKHVIALTILILGSMVIVSFYIKTGIIEALYRMSCFGSIVLPLPFILLGAGIDIAIFKKNIEKERLKKAATIVILILLIILAMLIFSSFYIYPF